MVFNGLIGSWVPSLVALLLLIQLYRITRLRGLLPHPPGPPGHFLIGSKSSGFDDSLIVATDRRFADLRDMPSRYFWHTFTEWGRKYGPISYVNVFGKGLLVINTQEAAIDLLDKRASIYSDRADSVMCAELCGACYGVRRKSCLLWLTCLANLLLPGFGEVTLLKPDGPELRKERKLFAQALHPRVVRTDFEPLQEKAARKLCKTLLEDPNPERLSYHIR